LLLSQSPTTTTTHISQHEEIASLFLEKEDTQHQQPRYFGNREAFYRAKEAEDNEQLRLEWT
jgi:hypothetical protein